MFVICIYLIFNWSVLSKVLWFKLQLLDSINWSLRFVVNLLHNESWVVIHSFYGCHSCITCSLGSWVWGNFSGLRQDGHCIFKASNCYTYSRPCVFSCFLELETLIRIRNCSVIFFIKSNSSHWWLLFKNSWWSSKSISVFKEDS